ncbi:Phosphocholine transferase AnkX [Pelomyxa schiedti]|nr:Phosphocholine transferase AnkX [Pelomyxa schiedti]
MQQALDSAGDGAVNDQIMHDRLVAVMGPADQVGSLTLRRDSPVARSPSSFRATLSLLVQNGLLEKQFVESVLHTLCRFGDVEGVSSLLEAHPKPATVIDCVDSGVAGNTPLMAAALRSHFPLIELLIQRGANVNATNSQLSTALHKVVSRPGPGDATQCVKFLLGHGALVHVQDKFGDTILHKAIRQRNHECISVLLSHLQSNTTLLESILNTKNKQGNSPIHEAAMIALCRNAPNPSTELGLLLSHISDPTPLHLPDSNGNTALHLACMAQSSFATPSPSSTTTEDSCASLLLKCGSNPNVVNNNGDCPIHAPTCTPSDAALLLKYGAAIDARNKNGKTALHISIESGFTAKSVFLVENNASLDGVMTYRDKSGNTLLHQLATNSEYSPALGKVVSQLLKVHIPWDQEVNNAGCSPLHLACESNSLASIDILLGDPSNIIAMTSVCNSMGLTPLDQAIYSGSVNAVVSLLQKNATFNKELLLSFKDSSGRTMLHKAVELAAPQCIRMLVECGCDVNGPSDNQGPFSDWGTPLHFAARLDSPQCATELLRCGANANSTASLGGNTPVHLACYCGAASCLSVLLLPEHHADINLTNSDGETPMDCAAKHQDCIDLLQNH